MGLKVELFGGVQKTAKITDQTPTEQTYLLSTASKSQELSAQASGRSPTSCAPPDFGLGIALFNFPSAHAFGGPFRRCGGWRVDELL